MRTTARARRGDLSGRQRGHGALSVYDRWSDAYNVTTEYIAVNQARSLMVAAFLAARSPQEGRNGPSPAR